MQQPSRVSPYSSFDRAFSVLVVDPERGASGTLDALGASTSHVDVALDFSSALAAIAESRPDVLITECRLGEYNGLHLAMRLRADDPTALAIVLASFPDRVLEREAERLGAVYLAKPVAPAFLHRIIREGLSQRCSGACSVPDGPRSRETGRHWHTH